MEKVYKKRIDLKTEDADRWHTTVYHGSSCHKHQT